MVLDNIRFEVKDGKIVEATCDGDQSTSCNDALDIDEGARYFGEFALGVNPYITKPMLDTLFDEKISGSFHLTPGNAYEAAYNGNKSAQHWDIVTDPDPGVGRRRDLVRRQAGPQGRAVRAAGAGGAESGEPEVVAAVIMNHASDPGAGWPGRPAGAGRWSAAGRKPARVERNWGLGWDERPDGPPLAGRDLGTGAWRPGPDDYLSKDEVRSWDTGRPPLAAGAQLEVPRRTRGAKQGWVPSPGWAACWRASGPWLLVGYAGLALPVDRRPGRSLELD